ncbi:hypothetical protein QN277_002017 [Acacia crassicarpa]|uniref:Cysteine proteinase inhibitor n=1 Tax=Acacia crassicarpa TaxID=499986 RepID=A0AAE1N8E3_9FABA|nr:hypothetical protein QN277_002017 [Acacia crassicarpa]
MRALNSSLLSSFSIPSSSFLSVFFFLLLVRSSLADCSDFDRPEMATLGGIHDSPGAQNSADIDGLARFAVDEHNKKENALLEFARVVKAQEQVVAELQEFKHAGDVPAFTSSDLGAKGDGHKTGWQTVPAHDPQVQDAANHAVKTLQQRSNSLLPYELHEVVDAKAEVNDDSAKFNLLLKVKRGGKEEKFKAEVHQNHQGGYHLNQMEQDHS